MQQGEVHEAAHVALPSCLGLADGGPLSTDGQRVQDGCGPAVLGRAHSVRNVHTGPHPLSGQPPPLSATSVDTTTRPPLTCPEMPRGQWVYQIRTERLLDGKKHPGQGEGEQNGDAAVSVSSFP